METAATGPLASSTNYTTAFTYDAAGQLTGLTDPAGSVYSFTYDAYDARGTLHTTQYPNGTFTWSDYNAGGSLTATYNRHGTLSDPLPSSVPADASPIVDYAYTYRADGKKTQETRSAEAWAPRPPATRPMTPWDA